MLASWVAEVHLRLPRSLSLHNVAANSAHLRLHEALCIPEGHIWPYYWCVADKMRRSTRVCCHFKAPTCVSNDVILSTNSFYITLPLQYSQASSKCHLYSIVQSADPGVGVSHTRTIPPLLRSVAAAGFLRLWHSSLRHSLSAKRSATIGKSMACCPLLFRPLAQLRLRKVDVLSIIRHSVWDDQRDLMLQYPLDLSSPTGRR